MAERITSQPEIITPLTHATYKQRYQGLIAETSEIRQRPHAKFAPEKLQELRAKYGIDVILEAIYRGIISMEI